MGLFLLGSFDPWFPSEAYKDNQYFPETLDSLANCSSRGQWRKDHEFQHLLYCRKFRHRAIRLYLPSPLLGLQQRLVALELSSTTGVL